LITYKTIEYGEHTFKFDIRDSFFEKYDNADILSANLKVLVLLNKKKTHIEINFDINGIVSLACDRCLEAFDNTIKINQSIYIQFGDEGEDTDENLYFLPESEYEIDLSKFINELIVVNLPMRRVHPEDKNGNPTCPNNMLEYIKNIKNEGSIDPRWNELNKLRDGTS